MKIFTSILTMTAVFAATAAEPVVPPYLNSFETEASVDGFTFIDSNKDGVKWHWEKGYGTNQGYIRISENADMAADDWFITPAVSLRGGEEYQVSFLAWAKGFPERLEVCVGTAPTAAAMTTKIVSPIEIGAEFTEQEPKTVSGTITAAADGVYYIGIHGISDADQFNLNLDNLQISAAMSGNVPAAVANLSVTVPAYGSHKADISFKAPDKTIGGAALESIIKIEILRSGSDVPVKVFETVTPGETLKYTDTVINPGTYTYTVVAYNAAGKGELATADVFCGVELPEEVMGVFISEGEPGEVILKWHPVTLDINRKELPEGSVAYNVYGYDAEGKPTVQIVERVADTSYKFTAYTGASQEFVHYFVCAVTETGEGIGRGSDVIPVGHPYTDFKATFADGTSKYNWWLGRSNDYVNIGFMKDTETVKAQDGDNGFAIVSGELSEMAGSFYSGKISLGTLEKPEMTFYTYNFENGDNINENLIIVEARATNGEFEKLMEKTVWELTDNNAHGWIKATVDMSAYAGKDIEFSLGAVMKNTPVALFDNVSFAEKGESGIAAPGADAASGTIYAAGGSIIIEGAAGEPVSVYSLDGRVLCSRPSASDREIIPAGELAGPGAYIVKAGTQAAKVMVR